MDLLLVAHDQLVEVDVTEAGVVHLGRDGGRATRGSDGARDETGLVRLLGRPLVGGGLGQLRRHLVQLVDDRLEAVVGLRDRSAVERVGLADISAGTEVLLQVRAHNGGRTKQRGEMTVSTDVSVVTSNAPSDCITSSASIAHHRKSDSVFLHADTESRRPTVPTPRATSAARSVRSASRVGYAIVRTE